MPDLFMNEHIATFIKELSEAVEKDAFVKLILSKPLFGKEDGGEKVVVRVVLIQDEKKLTFVFQYPTKHSTKNYTLNESVEQLHVLLGDVFTNAVLFTTAKDVRLNFNRKQKSNLRYSRPTITKVAPMQHDLEKERYITLENNQYLRDLGVAREDGQVAHTMRSKYRQINRYIETIDEFLKVSDLCTKDVLTVADMGSGKGYLTFALYDFLTNTLKKEAHVTGVDRRAELVTLCNDISAKCEFSNLHFKEGDIAQYQTGALDMLIALHACDTATDDAIAKGITAGASVVIVAPCCHRQIRKELHVSEALKTITKHGILEERQAEIVTDALRGLVLEAYGYKVRIFEFITDEHTHKNVMIVGVKNEYGTSNSESVLKMQELKQLFGIENFYLETLLPSFVEE
jgi:SAM-dependent methyltransferase